MTSRTSTRRVYNRAIVAYRSPDQLARRRRIESLIRFVAPALDVVLYAGDRASRIVGRNEIGPEPARRVGLPPSQRR
jgi:hypothetical protein